MLYIVYSKVAGVVSRTAGHRICWREPSRTDMQITPRRPDPQGTRLPRTIASHHGNVYIDNVITDYHGLPKKGTREPYLGPSRAVAYTQ